jgi:DNA-binding transcriptional LysR family regulator
MTSAWPDLDDLALLLLIGETGSLGRAGRATGQSQPSVSRRIAALERSMRVQLLHRGPTGSTFTPAGRVILDWAASLLDAADEFNRSVETLRSRRRVAVRVAVSMTIAEYLAPEWLQKMQKRAPDTTIALHVANSTDVGDLVESGRADIGFVESPTVERGLRTRRVGYDSLTVVVAPGHDWARREAVAAADLAGTPLLVREKGSGTRETLAHALTRAGLEYLPAMELPSNSALKTAAVAGMGPAVISGLAVTHELATGALVEVRVHGIHMRRPLTAVWRRDQDLTADAVRLYAVARGP